MCDTLFVENERGRGGRAKRPKRRRDETVEFIGGSAVLRYGKGAGAARPRFSQGLQPRRGAVGSPGYRIHDWKAFWLHRRGRTRNLR